MVTVSPPEEPENNPRVKVVFDDIRPNQRFRFYQQHLALSCLR